MFLIYKFILMLMHWPLGVYLYHSNNFNIKWITIDSELPIVIAHYERGGIDAGYDHKWHKYYENIELTDEHREMYRTKINKTHNIIQILTYDYLKHDQLDHYQLISASNPSIKNGYVYTLAYLRSIEMPIQENSEFITASCIVRFTVPLGINNEHTKFIQDQLQNRVSIDLTDVYSNDNNQNGKQKFLQSNKVILKRQEQRVYRRNPIDRYVIDLELSIGPVIIHKLNKDDSLVENLTCTLLLEDTDSTKTRKTLLKTIKQFQESPNSKESKNIQASTTRLESPFRIILFLLILIFILLL